MSCDVMCCVNADEENGDVSKLEEVPAAKRKGVKRPQPKLDSNRYFRHQCFHKMQDSKRESGLRPPWLLFFFFRLISDRGLPALRTLFDDVRFKGKGHEVRADMFTQTEVTGVHVDCTSSDHPHIGVFVCFCPTRRRTCGG